MKIKELRLQAQLPLLEIDILLQHVLSISREKLFTSFDNLLTAHQLSELQTLIDLRKTGKPIAYLVGKKEFWSLEFKVTPEVLIPRPDTEILVAKVLELFPIDYPAKILELGVGSGAISVALKKERPHWFICASDISTSALAIAQENALAHQVDINFFASDWFNAINYKFDCIISNPPYLSSTDKYLTTDIKFEPYSALVSGQSGLECLAHLINRAKIYLVYHGWLVLEYSSPQTEILLELLNKNNFNNTQVVRDYADANRVVVSQVL